MKNSNDLKPSIEREFSLLNYVAERMQGSSVLEDVSDLLFYHESKALFNRIKSGEDVSNDHTLPDAFLMGYLSTYQFEATKVYLSDLKGRRDAYNENVKALEKVFNPDIDYSAKDNFFNMGELIDSSIEQIINNPRGLHPDKWHDFFSVPGGFLEGELIGIAGGTGSGKTTFAIELIHAFQEKYDVTSAIISCEMSAPALAKKIIKRVGGITSRQYVYLVHNDKERIKTLNFKNWEKCLFHHKIYKLEEIQSFVRKHKPKFWVLDHVAMIVPQKNYSQGEWAVYLSNSLKAICKETGTIGICLYQLDKESQKRGRDGKSKVPTLADIYGGIGSKMALDTGIVCYQRDGDHFVYWDKVRDYYDEQYRHHQFKSNGNSSTGEIFGIDPVEFGNRVTFNEE